VVIDPEIDLSLIINKTKTYKIVHYDFNKTFGS